MHGLVLHLWTPLHRTFLIFYRRSMIVCILFSTTRQGRSSLRESRSSIPFPLLPNDGEAICSDTTNRDHEPYSPLSPQSQRSFLQPGDNGRRLPGPINCISSLWLHVSSVHGVMSNRRSHTTSSWSTLGLLKMVVEISVIRKSEDDTPANSCQAHAQVVERVLSD